RCDPENMSARRAALFPLAEIRYNSIRSISARNLDADRTRKRERAFRSRHAQVKAHRGEDRVADRTARPRILREADFGKKAQARRCGQAPSQAPAQPDAAAKAVLIRPDPRGRERGSSRPSRPSHL